MNAFIGLLICFFFECKSDAEGARSRELMSELVGDGIGWISEGIADIALREEEEDIASSLQFIAVDINILKKR